MRLGQVRSFIPFALLALFPVLLLWRVVFLGEVFLPADLLQDVAPWRRPGAQSVPWNPLIWDGIAQFYPWRAFAAATERAGYLPLWNPHQFCGAPFAANSQSAIYYPPNILFALMPVAHAFGVSVLLHLWATGAFLYLFLRRSMAAARGSALVGAVAWQLCTWQVSWLHLPTFLCVSAWIPAALLAADRLAARAEPRSATALGLSLGMMLLAGHLQVCLYGFLLILAWTVFRLPVRRTGSAPDKSDRSDRSSAIPAAPDRHVGAHPLFGTLAAAAAVALLLGLAQLLPSVELARMSHRAGSGATAAGYKMYTALAVPFYELAAMVAPDVYGNATAGTYWGYTEYPENASYVGLFPLILAVTGTLALWRRRETRFWAAAAVVALLIATGTPIDALLYFGVPGFSQTGSPGRVLVVWSLAVSVLAAVGMEAILARSSVAIRRPLLAAAASIALLTASALASAQAAFSGLGDPHALVQNLSRETDLWRIPCVVLGGGLAIVLAYRRGRLGARAAAGAMAALTALDLLASGVPTSHTVPAAAVYPSTPSIAYLQQHAGMERVMPVNRGWSLDPANPPHAVLPPNAATVYGLYDTQGYDSLLPGQYMAFARQVNDGEDPAPQANGNMVFTRGLTSDAALALAPHYVLAPAAVDVPSQLVPLLTDGDTTLYQNQAALPRFSVEGSDAVVTASMPAPTRLNVTVPAPAQAGPLALVVRDQWFPGWHADVDGRPAALEEAPFIFRTVRWTAASQRPAVIHLRYEPATTRLGIYSLSLGWALALGLMAASWSRRREGAAD